MLWSVLSSEFLHDYGVLCWCSWVFSLVSFFSSLLGFLPTCHRHKQDYIGLFSMASYPILFMARTADVAQEGARKFGRAPMWGGK